MPSYLTRQFPIRRQLPCRPPHLKRYLSGTDELLFLTMNPRDLPEVVTDLLIEMHEVRSELNAINGRLDRLEGQMVLIREENSHNTDRLIDAFSRSRAPLITRLLDHDDQLKNHEGRLNTLKNPSA